MRSTGYKLQSWVMWGINCGLSLLRLSLVAIRRLARVLQKWLSAQRLSAFWTRGTQPPQPAKLVWPFSIATGILSLILLLVCVWSGPIASSGLAPNKQRPKPRQAEQPVLSNQTIATPTTSVSQPDLKRTSTEVTKHVDRTPASAEQESGQPESRQLPPAQLELEVIHEQIVPIQEDSSSPVFATAEATWLQFTPHDDATWSTVVRSRFPQQKATAQIPRFVAPTSNPTPQTAAPAQQLQVELYNAVSERAVIGQQTPMQIIATNRSRESLSEIVISQLVPEQVHIISATDAVQLESGELQWHLHNLSPGETRRVGAIVEPITPGTVSFSTRTVLQAAVASTTIVDAHRLSLSLTAPDQLQTGEFGRLRFRFANIGNTHPENLLLRLYLPPQLNHNLGSTLDLKIADLPSGAEQLARLHVKATQASERVVVRAELVADEQVITATTTEITITPAAPAQQ